jgi:hypothetical protein
MMPEPKTYFFARHNMRAFSHGFPMKSGFISSSSAASIRELAKCVEESHALDSLIFPILTRQHFLFFPTL